LLAFQTVISVSGTSAAQGHFLFDGMLDFSLSPAVQQWIHVVLIWVGFGTLAGLLATVIFPFRAVRPFSAIVIGIVGSTVGLLGLSWLFPDRPMNPISILGFLAATIGAFVVLLVYRLGGMWFGRRDDESGKPQG
jgi:uncharacterized membrane protein YeaQ/YmgE (transglycosylase-associated protein family)